MSSSGEFPELLEVCSSLTHTYSIRYAQAPVGKLRWQAPRAPLVNRSDTLEALEPPSQCPQGYAGSNNILPTDQTGSSEDCLFLNVWSPNTVLDRLPVVVWIHGGGQSGVQIFEAAITKNPLGYGEGSAATVSLDTIVSTNNNTFVAVAIQYRVSVLPISLTRSDCSRCLAGCFWLPLIGRGISKRCRQCGYTRSDHGAPMGAAVVRQSVVTFLTRMLTTDDSIHLFGGDPDKVTIMGESAGAGSVMLQTIAYGGTLGTQLFRNSIAASPYLPVSINPLYTASSS